MAVLIDTITADADQTHTLLTEIGDVGLRVRFHPTTTIWTVDVTYGARTVYGIRLAAGTRHIQGARFPFDLAVTETTGSGLCPYKLDDFASGRCQLWYVTAAEMTEIRGVEVPLASDDA